MIVRWGLGELGPLLDELDVSSPLLVTSERFAGIDLPIERRFTGVQPHTPTDSVEAAVAAAAGADGLVALGGGSAIDTAKNVSAATGLPVVSVPTTYSGSEWTTYFGRRDVEQGIKGGGGGAQTVGIVYEPKLTLELPPALTAGTAMNALAHAAEALYVDARSAEGDREALTGAELIAAWLPPVLEDGTDLPARTGLLRGAAHAGAALAASFMGLAHAMAQALGGRYGAPHGAMNALTLPPVLEFNRLGRGGRDRPPGRVARRRCGDQGARARRARRFPAAP